LSATAQRVFVVLSAVANPRRYVHSKPIASGTAIQIGNRIMLHAEGGRPERRRTGDKELVAVFPRGWGGGDRPDLRSSAWQCCPRLTIGKRVL
jgi:hypothetical protein